MQLLPPLLPLQLARPFLLAFEWATRHPPLLLHNLPTLGIGDIKWAGTAGNCSVQNQPVARQRKWGTGTAALPTSTNTGPPTHPDLHQFTGALNSLLVHQRARWSPRWWQTRSGALLAPSLTHGSKQVAAQTLITILARQLTNASSLPLAARPKLPTANMSTRWALVMRR